MLCSRLFKPSRFQPSTCCALPQVPSPRQAPHFREGGRRSKWSSKGRRSKCLWLGIRNLGGGNSNIFYFHPYLGKMNPFWRAYFSNGLKPPTRNSPEEKKGHRTDLQNPWSLPMVSVFLSTCMNRFEVFLGSSKMTPIFERVFGFLRQQKVVDISLVAKSFF